MQVNYRAYDANGQTTSGVITAQSEGEALGKLRSQGLFPYEASSVPFGNKTASWLQMEIGRSKPSLAERAAFARMLAALLRAGIPLDKALHLIASDNPRGRIPKLAHTAAEKISGGSSFSQTLNDTSTGFAADEIGLIRSGEQTGTLVTVLAELSNLLERRLELRGRLGSAAVYPAVLLVMALASLVVIATVLIPSITPLFEQSGKDLPIIISVMLSIQHAFSTYGWIILAGAALASTLIFALLRRPEVYGKLQSLWYLWSIPRDIEAARICRTLGTLLRNGVQLQNAISVTSGVAKNLKTQAQLAQTVEKVTAGSKLSVAIKDVAVLDPSALQMIGIGEETNRLDSILLHLAESREADTSRRIERLMTLLTPVMTVLLGMLIGGLIMSVMRAILSVNELTLQ